MFVVCDIECNKLVNPDKIWCVVIREVNNPENVHVFENVHENPSILAAFVRNIDCWIGHYFLTFDLPVLRSFGIIIDPLRVIDTVVVSRLINFGIEGGHSLEAWGKRLGEEKIGLDITDWTCYTKDILRRCIQDTLVNLKVYNYLKKYIYNNTFKNSLRLEHDIASLCVSIKNNGFGFDVKKARDLYSSIGIRLKEIDDALLKSFPSRQILVGTIIPRYTQQGAIHAVDYRRLKSAGYTDFDIENGDSFNVYETKEFNPGSLHDIIDRMWEAGWKPTEKTKGHTDSSKKSYGRNTRFKRIQDNDTDGGKDQERLARFQRYGWKLTEENLRTLPESAPEAAQRLVERLLLASRLSDLTEWLSLTSEAPTGPRIHGTFEGIGGWTQRLASHDPNMQNIPVAQHKDNPSPIDILSDAINDVMRELWIAPSGRRVVGVDADGIQMRVFAHYVNDLRLIKSLIEGNKKDGTDIHTLHWKALGAACKGRNPAKTFIYAWLLGAGAAKVAEILECSVSQAKSAIANFIEFYPGLKSLKSTRIPDDAKRGYFAGLDGRLVICPSEHKMLAGYLQNGEAIIMKRAAIHWNKVLTGDDIDYKLVTWPHDEWQTEIPDDDEIAQHVIDVQIESIVRQGVELGLNCPLAASGRMGYNWKETH